MRKWRERNKKHISDYKKLQYSKNPAIFIARSRKYAESHRAKVSEYHKAYYQKNIQSLKEKAKKYLSVHREDNKNRSSEWYQNNKERHRRYGMAYKLKHADKIKQYHRAWIKKRRKQNPEPFRASYRRWRESHKHLPSFKAKRQAIFMKYRALKKGATVNLERIKQFVLETKTKENFVCYHCGSTYPISALHFDHIIPLSRGGQHSVENLCASCARCNLSKNDSLIGEWVPERLNNHEF